MPWSTGSISDAPSVLEASERALAALRAAGITRADAGAILGSGLGGLFLAGGGARSLPFAEVPSLGATSVEGHPGRFLWCQVGGQAVLVAEGRRHLYEGVGMLPVALPVLLIAALGARACFLTCAAGGLDPLLGPGDLLLVRDHLDWTFRHPARELRWPEVPLRSGLYSPWLAAVVRAAARREGIPLREGVIAGVAGPLYETRGEIRLLRGAGAQAVTMSLVPEAQVAALVGLEVCAVAVIANRASPDVAIPADHAEVLAATARARDRLGRLLVQSLASQADRGAIDRGGAPRYH